MNKKRLAPIVTFFIILFAAFPILDHFFLNVEGLLAGEILALVLIEAIYLVVYFIVAGVVLLVSLLAVKKHDTLVCVFNITFQIVLILILYRHFWEWAAYEGYI